MDTNAMEAIAKMNFIESRFFRMDGSVWKLLCFCNRIFGGES